MLAITRSLPSQRVQLSISIANTRLRRCAQFIATWRAVVGLSEAAATALLPTPQRAGVTAERNWLCGANTP
jgi:hypothetical protein